MGTGRTVAAGIAAWTVGAVTAVAVGVGALTLIRGGLTAGPLPAAALSQPTDAPGGGPAAGLAPSGTRPVTPRPSTTGGRSPVADADRTVTTDAGTVVARCTPTGAYLVGWSPLPGFSPDDVVRGPAVVARVTFESRDRETRIAIRCVGGTVQPQITTEARHDD